MLNSVLVGRYSVQPWYCAAAGNDPRRRTAASAETMAERFMAFPSGRGGLEVGGLIERLVERGVELGGVLDGAALEHRVEAREPEHGALPTVSPWRRRRRRRWPQVDHHQKDGAGGVAAPVSPARPAAVPAVPVPAAVAVVIGVAVLEPDHAQTDVRRGSERGRRVSVRSHPVGDGGEGRAGNRGGRLQLAVLPDLDGWIEII